MMIPTFQPDWPLPHGVRASITCAASPGEVGGADQGKPYGRFNLAQHVGDDPVKVSACRVQLAAQLGVPPRTWLNQVHGTQVVYLGNTAATEQPFHHTVNANAGAASDAPTADACYTRKRKVACSILTADCLPVLLCNMQGTQVAAAHAGWRGLAAGVLEATCQRFAATDQLTAYLGPAISAPAFEVGAEVQTAFVQALGEAARACFMPSSIKPHHFQADLYGLARLHLLRAGVTAVSGGDDCTFTDSRFYSYRRQNVTGRFASTIWLE